MIEKNLIEWGNSGNLIREIALEAASRAAEKGAENVYNFTIGAPSIAPPPIIQETIDRLVATVPAVQLHTYAPAPGLPSTLRKIAAYLSETFGVDYTAKDIYMTHGSMSAIAIMCRALMSEGDEAVTLTPYFGEYRVFVEAVGAKMVEAPSRAADLQLDEAAFEAAITPRTAVVMLNSPNNPSGVVLNDESIRRASDILERKEMEYGHPIYIIADEPYRDLVYDGITVPFIPNYYKNTAYCFSFSKTLSMPGDRIGFIALHPEADNYTDVHAAMYGAARALGNVCLSPLLQMVAEECIGMTSDLSSYRVNRELLNTELRKLGYDLVNPDGAFYLFLKTPIKDSVEFCRKAMEYDIFIVPGEEFSMGGYARLAYCVPTERIEKSMPAFNALMDFYKGAE